jgi:hypothetical protein
VKSIKSLRGLGRGRKCLIIGGGVSLSELEFSLLPSDIYIISINNHCYKMADMIIYYDKDMREFHLENEPKPFQLLLGFRHSTKLDHTSKNCTHYYSYENMIFGDSGFHALQFADSIFNFKEIYLAGYDYYTTGRTYHHNEDVSDPDKMYRFNTWSIGKVLDKYSDIEWKNKIYNCNKLSKLTEFNYKLPY